MSKFEMKRMKALGENRFEGGFRGVKILVFEKIC